MKKPVFGECGLTSVREQRGTVTSTSSCTNFRCKHSVASDKVLSHINQTTFIFNFKRRLLFACHMTRRFRRGLLNYAP